MSGTTATVPAKPVTAPATYAHIVDGVVREVYTVPAALAGFAVAKLFPATAKWVPVNVATVAPGWTYSADGVFAAPAPVAPGRYPTMSPLTFLARFTPAEEATLYAAAMSSVQIFQFLHQCAAAQQIDVTDPRTVAAVNALVSAGLLTAARGTEVLTP